VTRYPAKGTQLEAYTGSSWVAVAQVYELAGPSERKDVREITGPHHVAAGYRVYRETLRDGGDVTLGLHWDPSDSSHDASTGLQAKLAGTGPHSWRITFPDATVVTFTASIVFHEPSAPADGKLTLFATLKVSGTPTWS
jgi:hypothetical protein